jgi:hypothetical protein
VKDETEKYRNNVIDRCRTEYVCPSPCSASERVISCHRMYF